MKNDNNESEPQKESVFDRLNGLISVESSTELTGLTPSLPLDDDDLESYSELQSMPKQNNKPDRKK